MKSLLLITLSLGYYSFNAQWAILGQPGFSANRVDYVAMAINPATAEPYVCFLDRNRHSRMSVMRYNGHEWVYVGSAGFSDGGILGGGIAFNREGIPYVVFSDGPNNISPTVMRFDGVGTVWRVVGQKGITGCPSSYTSIDIDQNGVPYIAFRDCKENNYGLSVMRYDGDSWEFVGTRAFTDPVQSHGGASHITLTLDNNGTPHVAYQDHTLDFVTTVQRFNGYSWELVGKPGFAGWNATHTRSLAFDSKNRPYLACVKDGITTALRFENGEWTEIGSPAEKLGGSEFATIALDAQDIPYLAFQDYAVTRRISVTRCVNGHWEYVGEPGFSPSSVQWVAVDIDKYGNIYTAFADRDTPHPYWRSTVMKFSNPDAVSLNERSQNGNFLHVYPNPSEGRLTVSCQSGQESQTLQIMTLQGQTIYSKTFDGRWMCETIDVSQYAHGTYLLAVRSGELLMVKRTVIE